MRSLTTTALAVVFLVTAASVLIAADFGDDFAELVPGIDYVQGEVIIILKPGSMPSRSEVDLPSITIGVESLDRTLNTFTPRELCKLIPTYNSYTHEAVRRMERTFLYRYSADIDAKEVVRRLSSHPAVEKVILNHLLTFELYGIPRVEPDPSTSFDTQWNLDDETDEADIDAPEAWAIEMGDPNLILGVFDEGTQCNPYTSGNWTLNSDLNYYFNPGEDHGISGPDNADLDDDDDDEDGWIDNVIGITTDQRCPQLFMAVVPVDWKYYDIGKPPPCYILGLASGHGIATAGVAAASHDGANVVGIAPNCMVHYARFSLQDYPETLYNMERAVWYLAAKCSVVNMSFGAQWDPDFQDIYDAFTGVTNDPALDCLFVAATGNSGHLGRPVSFPASHPDVMAVGSMTYDLELADYSQWTSGTQQVDCVAPVGDGIPVNKHTDPCPGTPPCDVEEVIGGMTEYVDNWAGTSFAAPQAAGIALLIRSRFPALSQDQVRDRINNAAEFYWETDPDGIYKFGHGKVNAYRALTELGPIAENTTWGAVEGMPDTMYVSGDLVIEEGVTLTLNPGTVVKVACEDEEHDPVYGLYPDKVEIIVLGTLEIGSTGTGDVIFESHCDTQGSDDWAGIRWTSGTSAHIEKIIVRNASPAIAADEVDFVSSDQNEEKSIFLNTSLALDGTYTVSEDASLYILGDTDVEMEADATHKIDVNGTIVSLGNSTTDVVITSDVELSNDWIGIVLSTSSHDNIIGYTALKHYQTGINAYNTDVQISNVDFYNGIIGVQVNQWTTGVIEHCSMSGHPKGIVNVGSPAMDIEHCTISGSTTYGVYCLSGADNRLYGNTIQSCNIGVYCDASSPLLEWNTIQSNGIGVSAIEGSNPDVGNGSQGSVGNNSILSNTPHHIVNLTPSVTIKAENNWWGSARGPKSTKFSGAVDYTPWLTSAPGSPPLGAPDDGGDEKDVVPVAHELVGGLPNPFNPATTILYTIAAPGSYVNISIYDVNGRLVKRLVDRQVPPGTHSIVWNGTNSIGSAAASGIYFIRMKADNFNMTKKLILLR